MSKTVAFFGASVGVGLATLKHTLAAGHSAIALCRTPSKLTDKLPLADNPHLTVLEGDATDATAVTRAITVDNGKKFVDTIVFTVGSRFSGLTIDDPTVCRRAMAALLEAVASARAAGASGRPRITACSSTGLSKFARDVPLLMVPLYHVLLHTPHEDKRAMEAALQASGEDFTVVRCSLFMGEGETESPLRVGVEDPETGVESKAIGYTISREDAGRWWSDSLVKVEAEAYLNKYVTITY